MKPHHRASLRYQLHQLDSDDIGHIERIIIQKKNARMMKSPLAIIALLAITVIISLAIIFIQDVSIIRSLIYIWGAYVISLDTLLIFRAFKRNVGYL